MSNFFRRFLVAALIYGFIFSFLGALHDYPQLRLNMHSTRLHNSVIERRQWLFLFYLVNEAGSGLKFLLTGNERHMGHFPSPSHILAAREAKAISGDFDMQMRVARMYYFGKYVPRDVQKSVCWLHHARNTANTPEQAQLAEEFLEYISAQNQETIKSAAFC